MNDEDRSVPAVERKRVLVGWEVTFFAEAWGDLADPPPEIAATDFRVSVPNEDARSRDDAIAVAVVEYMLPLAKRLRVDPRLFSVDEVRTVKLTLGTTVRP